MNPLDMHFPGIKFHSLHQILKEETEKLQAVTLQKKFINNEEEKQSPK